LAELRKISENQ